MNHRVVHKNGEFNVEKCSINRHGFGCVFNCFVTFVDARWRWTLLYFFMGFTGDWLFFALVYWFISYTHGDLREENLPLYQNVTGWTPCIEEIQGFTSTFLFSVEIHTTLAYGRRSITLECPQAIFTMCIQCIVSSFLQAFMVGILFAKLTRPKSRAQTILFSKQAIVSHRDEKLCFRFRVGDVRKSRILNVNITAYLLRFSTDSGTMYEFDQMEMKTSIDGCESMFFLWPLCVVHVIDERSPLYEISAADLLCGSIEILVVFEGIIESTGQSVQARSSYTEADILWGNRFIPMVKYNTAKRGYDVDFGKFCETEQVETPLCSAKEFEEISRTVKSISNVNNQFYRKHSDDSDSTLMFSVEDSK